MNNTHTVTLIELIEIAYAKKRLDRFLRLVRQWIKDNKPNAYRNQIENNREKYRERLLAVVEEEKQLLLP